VPDGRAGAVALAPHASASRAAEVAVAHLNG
jgi:hypothetical protein